MSYPTNGLAFVTAQPKQYEIHSNFGMFPGERLLYHGDMQTGCCRLGDRYYTSVTDTRYIARKDEFICCNCCCKRPYQDTCIYLRDIAELREERKATGGCLDFCSKCCCGCLCGCKCIIPKQLRMYGTFGQHTIHIYGKERPDFELMISEAIGQHKLVNRY